MRKLCGVLVLFLLIVLGYCLLSCGPSPSSPPSSGGFTIHTVYMCGLYLTDVCESWGTTVQGQDVQDLSGAAGTVYGFPWTPTADCDWSGLVCTNQAAVFISGARFPARWSFQEGNNGCAGRTFAFAVMSNQVELSCSGSNLSGNTISPPVFDRSNPPATAEITGEGIDPTYGMPLVQYYDSNGTLQAQAYATSVSSDATSMTGPVPDFSSAPLGTYSGVVSNVDANSNYYVIGAVSVDVIDSSVPPPGFSISISPDSQTVPYTCQSAYYTVTVTATGGFSDTVALSVDWVGDNEPNGLTVGMQGNQVTGSGTVTVWAYAIMPGYYTIVVTGESGNLGDVEYAQLIVQ